MGLTVKAIKFCFSVLFVVVLVVLAIGFFASKGEKPAAKDPNSLSELVADGAPALPASERNFIGIVSKAQSDSRHAENDMQKGGVKAQRDRSACSAIGYAQAQDWIGTVKTIDSNSDGKGVLAIEIAPDVLIETWNNSLSDIGSNTLIEPGSPVFVAASAMKTGQLVDFSGVFVPSSEGSCLWDADLTLDSKLQSPDFIFRFSKVSAYDSNQRNAAAPPQAVDKEQPSELETPPSASGANAVEPDNSTTAPDQVYPSNPAPAAEPAQAPVNPPSTSAPPASN